MDNSPKLIQKFFNKQCTSAEAAEVSAFLENNPEVMDRYLSKAEWDEQREYEDKPEFYWEEIWENIQSQKQPVLKINWLQRIAVAASILVFLSIGSWWFLNTQTAPYTQQAAFKHRIIKNAGSTIQQIALTDGSTVQLSAHSTLEFDEPFQNHKRQLHLTGEAVFEVAKDKTRPFTVYSGAIATTALGTKFRVVNYSGQDLTQVHLYEGKVVIQNSNPKHKILSQDFFLSPGDELLYNNKLMTATLNSPATSKTAKAKGKKGSWISFNKTALASVFDQLAAKYQTRIQYTNDEVKDLYFIGDFEKADSLFNILENIGQLNGLKVQKNTTGGYTISK